MLTPFSTPLIIRRHYAYERHLVIELMDAHDDFRLYAVVTFARLQLILMPPYYAAAFASHYARCHEDADAMMMLPHSRCIHAALRHA